LVTETTNQKATEQKEADQQTVHVHELRFSLHNSQVLLISLRTKRNQRDTNHKRREQLKKMESACIQVKKEIEDIGGGSKMIVFWWGNE
jgi:hypothetical protein